MVCNCLEIRTLWMGPTSHADGREGLRFGDELLSRAAKIELRLAGTSKRLCRCRPGWVELRTWIVPPCFRTIPSESQSPSPVAGVLLRRVEGFEDVGATVWAECHPGVRQDDAHAGACLPDHSRCRADAQPNRPPSCMASMALTIRLEKSWRSSPEKPRISQPSSNSFCRPMFRLFSLTGRAGEPRRGLKQP